MPTFTILLLLSGRRSDSDNSLNLLWFNNEFSIVIVLNMFVWIQNHGRDSPKYKVQLKCMTEGTAARVTRCVSCDMTAR